MSDDTENYDGNNTNIQNCVEEELERYFRLLDGQAPHDLYRLVMSQVEIALLRFTMGECNDNQSRAAEYLGISRGTLRSKLTDYKMIRQKVSVPANSEDDQSTS